MLQRSPDGTLPGERQLARTCGVARMTLRHVLAHLAETGLLRRRQGSRTGAPPSLAGRPPGIVWIGETDTHVYAGICNAIQRTAERFDVPVRLVPVQPERWRSIRPGWRPCAAAGHQIICQIHCLPAILPRLPRRAPPPVVVGLHEECAHLLGRGLRTIWGDRAAAARLCARHLLERGHRRFAVVALLMDYGRAQRSEASRVVIDAACEVVTGSGGTCRAIDMPDPEDATLLANILRALQPRPTAIIADMGYTAATVYAACRLLRWRIGRDVAVAGIGDTPWSQARRPHLTSVSYEPWDIGEAAVAAALLGQPQARGAWRIEPHLVVRTSSARMLRR